MAYQIQPIEFKKIIEGIVNENIDFYSNKREADTLLLNADDRSEENEDILARIEDYTTKIDRLQAFLKKCEPLYGTAHNERYTSSVFLKEFSKKCGEYSSEVIAMETFFSDLMFIAIEKYLQLRARNSSTIVPQIKVCSILVSRETEFSFSGTETQDKYTITSQNPMVASIERDSENPWVIHVKGVQSGTTNIIIEDIENEVSVQVPTIIRASTLYCPAEVKLIETAETSFDISSNIDPIEVSGLIFDGEKYVEQTYEEDGEIKHPFEEFELSRVNDTVTIKGLKPTNTPVKLACSIYDQTKNIVVKVLPCTLALSAYNMNIRSGKRQNVNMQLNVDISNLSYDIEDLVNEDIIDLEISEIGSNNYNIEIRGKKSGHCVVTFHCGSQNVDLDVYVTERTQNSPQCIAKDPLYVSRGSFSFVRNIPLDCQHRHKLM